MQAQWVQVNQPLENLAFDEYRTTGKFGPGCVDLLYRTVSAVARIHNFPPPQGHQRWTREAIRETAHEFFSQRGSERLTALFVRAVDGPSLKRLLAEAVRNFFRDQARKTNRGHLYQRLRDVLMKGAAFEQVPVGEPGAGNWTLAGWDTPSEWQGRTEDLVRAAWQVPGIRILRWPTSRRRDPFADRESLERLLEGVLQAAGGSLQLEVLVDVAAHRFGLVEGPLIEYVPDVPEVAGQATQQDPAEVSAARSRAIEIWAQLTDRHRLLLSYMDGDSSVREIAAEVGLGKTTVADGMSSLKAALGVLLSDDDADRQAIMRELGLLAYAWAGQLGTVRRLQVRGEGIQSDGT